MVAGHLRSGSLYLVHEQVDGVGVGAEAGCEIEIVQVGIAQELLERGRTSFFDELAVAVFIVREDPDDRHVVFFQTATQCIQFASDLFLRSMAQAAEVNRQCGLRIADPDEQLPQLGFDL